MKKKIPLISIIVPCFNQAQFLKEALDSVHRQSFKNWECIIINDGSTDNTETIVQGCTLEDERFNYISQNNKGLSSARNAGIKIAKGEFILPLDADDKIADNYISEILQQFAGSPSLKLIYAKARKFGEVNEEWNLPEFSLKRLAEENMIYCSAIFRREDWVKLGGYDENMIYGWEDWEFWIRMLKDGGEVLRLDFTGFYYRVYIEINDQKPGPGKDQSIIRLSEC